MRSPRGFQKYSCARWSRIQDLDRLFKRHRDGLMGTLDAFLAKAQPG